MRNRLSFDKYGGHYHLHISSVDDLEHIVDLPDGRWMATSCPLFGLNVDHAFLKFLDANGTGRIISDNLRNAVRWLFKCLKPSESWTKNQPYLSLDLINLENPEGKALKSSAELVLENLNTPDSPTISLDQVRNRQKIMSQGDYNGDGVIPPETLENPELRRFVQDLMATIGSVTDASGLKGVNEAILDQFKKEAGVYLEWYNKGVIPEGESSTLIMPFGQATSSMFQIILSIRDKIDQFFAQCALVRHDPRTMSFIGAGMEELERLDYKDTKGIQEYLAKSSIAQPNTEGRLSLNSGINEFYKSAIKSLKEQVIDRIIGHDLDSIDEPQWNQIKGRFADYEAWIKSKPATNVETLGVDKLKSYLNSTIDITIREMIVEDKNVAGEIQQLNNLEKLLLYHQWLFEFANNYVSFPHLFDVDSHAIFEKGRLILGGREFTFSIQVENRNLHYIIAKNSGIYLLYLQVTGPRPEDNFEIAVAVTRGNSKEFYIGKRGVFFTMSGRELDAQILQIVENPISLWDSVKEPFRALYGMIGSRFAQITTVIQKDAEKGIAAPANEQQIIQTQFRQVQSPSPEAIPQAPPPKQDEPRSSGTARDLMVGTGLLVAGLGTAFKFVVDAARQLTQPRTLQVLLIMIGVFLIISISTATITSLRKLRRRDLGVLLQASGWAINGPMRLIRPMARLFCRRVKIPKGAKKRHKELLIPLEKIARRR